jgi:hypothetical protein
MPNIEISIRRRRPIIRSKASKKGPLDIHKEPDYLKRRLKKAGIIKFYDLGQKSDGHGGWVQNDYSHDLAWDIGAGGPSGNDGIFSTDPLSIDDLRDFEDSLLGGVDRRDFETTFRRIHKSDGNSFPVGFNGVFYDSADWVEDGLKITQSRLDEIYASNAIFVQVRRDEDPSVSLAGGGQDYLSQDVQVTVDPHIFGTQYKPTGPYLAAEPAAFTDPSVRFRPGLNDSYFLMPQLTQDLGVSKDGDVTVYLNNFAHMVFRDFSNPNHVMDTDFASPGWAEALAYHNAASYNRSFTITTTHDGPFDRLAITPGGTFPFAGGGDSSEVNFNLADSQGQGITFNYLGQLSLIIKQGEKFYYFWNKLVNTVEP